MTEDLAGVKENQRTQCYEYIERYSHEEKERFRKVVSTKYRGGIEFHDRKWEELSERMITFDTSVVSRKESR